MATNNFKLFDENKTNMMGDTEYGVNPQRLNGVQAGVASSELNNKFAYQMSLVAYSIAQMMNANGIDANDTQAVSAFVNGLSSTVMQKVVDKATDEMAIAGSDNSHYMTPALVKQSIEENDIFGKLEYRGKITKLQYIPLRNAIGEVTIIDYGNSSGTLNEINSIILKFNSFSVETLPMDYYMFSVSESEDGTFTRNISSALFNCNKTLVHEKKIIELKKGEIRPDSTVQYAAAGSQFSGAYVISLGIGAYINNVKTKKASIGIVNHTGTGDSVDCDIDVYVKVGK